MKKVRFDLIAPRILANVRAVQRIVAHGAAVIRDSLAVVGFAVIALLLVASQSEAIRHNLTEFKNVGEWLRPSLDHEFARISDSAAEPGSQLTEMMGLGDDAMLAQPQFASLGNHSASHQNTRKQQQILGSYLARRYRISAEAAQLVVGAAYETGKEVNLDPLLLLSVMAVESGLNPFAESTVGAQGLMQVLSKVHEDKLEAYGGKMAALNPVVNIKVGAIVLRDCIRRGGSLEAGLKLYVGATTETDNGYGAKVINTRAQLQAALGMQPQQTAQPQPVIAKPPLVSAAVDGAVVLAQDAIL